MKNREMNGYKDINEKVALAPIVALFLAFALAMSLGLNWLQHVESQGCTKRASAAKSELAQPQGEDDERLRKLVK